MGIKEKREIKTNILLFISTHDKSYLSPVLSNGKFNKLTDYQQIIATSFDSAFWNNHYVIPPDKQDTLSLKYFEEYGYVTNYQAYRSDSTLSRLLNGLVLWEGRHNLNLSELTYKPENETEIRKNMKDVHNQYFNSELFKLDVGYLLIPKGYNKTDSLFYEAQTFFNTANSYYFLNPDIYSKIAVNLYFDTFEKNRLSLADSIGNTIIIEDVEKILKVISEKTKKEADSHLKKCRRGAEIKYLIEWNESITSSIKTDRLLSAVNDTENENSGRGEQNSILFNYCTTVGRSYLEMKQYERAELFLFKALSYKENVPLNILSRLYYDLGYTYLAIDDYVKACDSFINAKAYGYSISKKFLNKNCNKND